jgi:glutathione S-transferase
MGAGESKSRRQAPDPNFDATLYYFAGRGVADQVRWLMSYSGIKWTQRVVATRDSFFQLVESRQLPFGQVPMLQIDRMELVQTQAIIRYLAGRGNLLPKVAADHVKCDMLAESLRDLIDVLTEAPFNRVRDEKSPQNVPEQGRDYYMIKIFFAHAKRLEYCIALNNKSPYLVGDSPTYVDVLAVHAITWFVEECGVRIMDRFSRLVNLQHLILENEGLRAFLASDLYYGVGDASYVTQVEHVLERDLTS